MKIGRIDEKCYIKKVTEICLFYYQMYQCYLLQVPSPDEDLGSAQPQLITYLWNDKSRSSSVKCSELVIQSLAGDLRSFIL